MRRPLAAPAAAGLVALALAGCSSGSAESGGSGRITVLAAASLQESFTTIGQQFEAANPGTAVTFGFAGSSALAQQIASGAPADVFASASASTMQQVVDAGAAGEPTVFATNSMQIAVPPDNPGDVTGVDDLADPTVTVALCQEQVPCGSTAVAVLDKAGITVTPVTLEPDVKAVLSKVTLGEVDAGVVYVTDVTAAGDDVAGVEIPADVNASTAYPIATLTGSADASTAREFVDYVLSPAGRAVLAEAGFGPP